MPSRFFLFERKQLQVLQAATVMLAIALTSSLGAEGSLDATPEAGMPQPWGYESVAGRCVVCHSLEQGGSFRVAPNLYGIYGAEKARYREWYNYSPALIEMGGTWTEEELDAFLADATAFAPGTTKSIRVTDEEERRAIIQFLKQLGD